MYVHVFWSEKQFDPIKNVQYKCKLVDALLLEPSEYVINLRILHTRWLSHSSKIILGNRTNINFAPSNALILSQDPAHYSPKPSVALIQ